MVVVDNNKNGRKVAAGTGAGLLIGAALAGGLVYGLTPPRFVTSTEYIHNMQDLEISRYIEPITGSEIPEEIKIGPAGLEGSEISQEIGYIEQPTPNKTPEKVKPVETVEIGEIAASDSFWVMEEAPRLYPHIYNQNDFGISTLETDKINRYADIIERGLSEKALYAILADDCDALLFIINNRIHKKFSEYHGNTVRRACTKKQ